MNQNILFEYCLCLGDTPLILGQRLGEWCGHGPILEEDIALTNISLDLFGQARAFLTYAGEIEGKRRSEDDLAFFRVEREFRNLLIAEQPNGDYAQTVLRQFLVSSFQYFLYDELSHSKDSTVAGIAAKSLKEVTYHLRHSSQWVIRIGDGTEESRRRILAAVDKLWMFTGDMFRMDETDKQLLKQGIAADLDKIKNLWDKKIKKIFAEANLSVPDLDSSGMIHGSREGKHTEYLGHILAEMQALPRARPGVQW